METLGLEDRRLLTFDHHLELARLVVKHLGWSRKGQLVLRRPRWGPSRGSGSARARAQPETRSSAKGEAQVRAAATS